MPTKTKSLPQWNLAQLYATEKALENDIARLTQRVKAFTLYRKKLEHPTRGLLEEILNEMEQTSRISLKIQAYAQLTNDRNTADEKARSRMSRITQLGAEFSNQELFFGIWWKDIDEKKVRGLLPRNKDHAHFLIEARKLRKHLLRENEEKIINLKNVNGIHAMERIYTQITSSMKFPLKRGKRIMYVSEEPLRKAILGPNPSTRKEAYDSLWNEYGKQNGLLGEIYRSIVSDYWNEEMDLRKFKSPISVRNISNDLSDETVETFLNVCEENTGVFQDYFAWKSTELGHPNARYHIYAPLPKINQQWEFEKAYQTVIRTFESFSPRFATEAKRVRDAQRLDLPVAPDKRNGAYTLGVTPEDPCFVLHNWAGTYNDTSTLAHELGHAVHAQLAGHHSIFVNHAPLAIAETASIFSEMILAEELMQENKNDAFTRHILSTQLQDAFASIPRQAFFTRFEQRAFDMIREGKTIPEINQAYYQTLRTQFGKKMSIPENAQYEWGMVGHMFEHPFYTYSYAFGQLLVLAFFERYQKEGKEFVRDYERFLAHGGSENTEVILREMGFYPEKRKSWEKGFRILEKKFKTLQSL